MKLTAAQIAARDVLNSSAKHILLDGGSRSGKTALIVRNIAVRAIKAPNSRHAILRFRFNHCKESIGLDTLPKVMQSSFPDAPYTLNKSDWYATLKNGSEIWLGGLDDKERTEKILGKEYSTIYLNECSQIGWQSRNIALTRLAQKCAYTLEGVERELALKMYQDCNPPNKGHWTYQVFYLQRDPETKKPLDNPGNYAHFTINPRDNAANLPADYFAELEQLPGRMRKRFLLGEYADATPNALFHDETIEKWRVLDGRVADFVRVVVAVDPSGSSDVDNADNDEIGISVSALGTDGNAYVLEDCSVKAGPATWGKIATDAYERHAADVIVGEMNYGGAMVQHTIQTARNRTPYKDVHATRGKVVRAEPISALYEQGKIRHVGYFRQMEDELSGFSTAGYLGDKSPNRADALIWGLTELFPGVVAGKREKKELPPPRRYIHAAQGWMS